MLINDRSSDVCSSDLHDIATDFSGDHCEALLNGLYYVNGRRHVDHHTLIGHSKPHGVSHEYYRGVLAGTARGVFSGRILVAPGAGKPDAVQRSGSQRFTRKTGGPSVQERVGPEVR